MDWPSDMPIVFRGGDPMDKGLEAESEILSLTQRMKLILFSEELSDVTFLVGATKETAKKIRAHRFPLAAASDVFRAMFSGKKDEPFQVIDFEAPTFCSLLRFIYINELVFPPDMLIDVVRIAKKYMMHSLIKFVADNFEKVDKKYVLNWKWRISLRKLRATSTLIRRLIIFCDDSSNSFLNTKAFVTREKSITNRNKAVVGSGWRCLSISSPAHRQLFSVYLFTSPSSGPFPSSPCHILPLR